MTGAILVATGPKLAKPAIPTTSEPSQQVHTTTSMRPAACTRRARRPLSSTKICLSGTSSPEAAAGDADLSARSRTGISEDLT
jgi:hypothetical protein